MGECAECSGAARSQCVCGRVWYCSKQCQRAHWRLHRRDCDKVLLATVGGEKGRGLVASQRIQWGEEILREQPLLLINNSSSLLAWSDTVLGLVRDLAERERRQLEELADNSGLADTAEFLYLRGVRGLSEESLRTLRIIRTNGINLAEDGESTGLYLRFSRVNHSCAPAAVRNIEPTTGTLSLIAARDIEKGEEITIKVEEN